MIFHFDKLKELLIQRHRSMIDTLSASNKLGPDNIFVAGGAVRDFICNKDVIKGDIDLFVSESGYHTMLELINSYGTNVVNQYGSYRWYPDQNNSFYYDLIKINDFDQGLWKCTDILDVLNQFDITANAIAFDLCDGTFFNPVNGARDANIKLIKAVRFDFPEIPVSASIPLARNSVLWFRYNHYAAKLNYFIEPVTKAWVMDNKFRMKDFDMFSKYFFSPKITV
jgi:hypothetical protein